MRKFVVFDTGTGGRLFAEELRRVFPRDEVMEVIDEANSPYGEKSAEEIRELTEAALIGCIKDDASIIVLACNTATAVCIDYLRAKYPERIFVGFEPMLKPAAAMTKTGKIIVLATPATERSEKYQELKHRYCEGVEVMEPDCSEWAAKIDAGAMREEDVLNTLLPYLKLDGDVVVLACTHYVAVKGVIEDLASQATVIAPFDAVIRHIKKDVLYENED
ncbi:MAG: aspartate/glutamate racemase family protein [Candidatus Nomurabacteria bacterium]|jgi:glutamate racemase|nr:aspartate/glutamate racemase family protein [Candidatus Nomurabacteria bacterium]